MDKIPQHWSGSWKLYQSALETIEVVMVLLGMAIREAELAKRREICITLIKEHNLDPSKRQPITKQAQISMCLQ